MFLGKKKLNSKSFQWMFLGFMGICTPAFSVVGPLLSSDSNPEFSCAVGYMDKDENLMGLCSGEAVSKNWFLTAGHCNDDPKYLPVVYCPHATPTVYPVTKVIIHPYYSEHEQSYDQALLQIEGEFPFDPVSLPKSTEEVNSLLKKECAIFGYGLDSSGNVGTLLGIPAQFNGAFFREHLVGLGSEAYPRPGDSGAGLLCREQKQSKWIRVGTVSQAEIGLATAALLSPSLNWIAEIIANESNPSTPQTKNVLPDSDMKENPCVEELKSVMDGSSPDSTEAINTFCQSPSPLNTPEDDYNKCVARVTFGAAAASADGDDWLKNNLEQVIRDQCGKKLHTKKTSSLQNSLNEADITTLFAQDPLRSANKIQGVKEAFTFFSIPIGEDLCDKTADNLFSDTAAGRNRSTFFIETTGGPLKFTVSFSSSHRTYRCWLEFSYEHNYKCQSCGTRWWERFNPIVEAHCDRIYVNQDRDLICRLDDKEYIVNINYLRFLNKHSDCFNNPHLSSRYHPSFKGLSAELTLHLCVSDQSNRASWVNLCSLNQLFFVQQSTPDFWLRDPEIWKDIEKAARHESCALDWFDHLDRNSAH